MMIRTTAKTVAKYLPFFVIVLAAVQIWLANELAGMGEAFGQIDQNIELLREQNTILSQQIASASSLIQIEQRANQMGFVEPNVSSYILLGDNPLALGL